MVCSIAFIVPKRDFDSRYDRKSDKAKVDDRTCFLTPYLPANFSSEWVTPVSLWEVTQIQIQNLPNPTLSTYKKR